MKMNVHLNIQPCGSQKALAAPLDECTTSPCLKAPLFARGTLLLYYLNMIHYLPFFFILFLAAGVATPACADEILKEGDAKGTAAATIRPETKRHHDYTGRPLAPEAVGTGREIVIDKQGHRIGLAIPNVHGETNGDLLRLRSGKRVGNQIFDPAGRRVGTIIGK
jgi:hypothetical protein